MITFTRKGDAIHGSLSYGIDGWQHQFKINFSDELSAILHERQLRNNLYNTIEKIRRDAYNLGWKDAKSKRVKKRTWFNGNINSEFV